MSILVVGGAGYIGSVTAHLLEQQGKDVIVLDNLSTGHRDAITGKFYEGDLNDADLLDEIFHNEDIEAVMHFAAFSIVPESMQNPLKYFNNNVTPMITLLEAMKRNAVNNLIFSSTAATYGEPERVPILETDRQFPTNPYGQSKLQMEQIMKWTNKADGLNFVALRYFNVAGAMPDGSIGEDHHPETHLIPNILNVARGKKDKIVIFGDDYATKDGTNVRDYVHVLDLAQAHIDALNYLKQTGKSDFFNIGSSAGFSNLEILNAARKVTGNPIVMEMGDRRPGDPATLIASSDKARSILNWQPGHENIEEMLQDAWKFDQVHPDGFTK